jgi:rifampicin phosphotransferase
MGSEDRARGRSQPTNHVLSLDAASPLRWMTGRKATRLAELRAAGHDVPDGFALRFDALDEHLAHAGLAERFGTLLADLERIPQDAIASGAEALRELILSADAPPALVEEVREAYTALGAPPVSVRSSSSLEDRDNLSFAGQHDSFLNIQSLDAILASIKQVWASAYSDRAVAYLRALGMSLQPLRMGVLVQRMVAADAAGVAFTIHPVSGARDRLFIAGTFGLGEGTVGGTVTPDEWIVDRARRAVLEYRAGDKAAALVAAAGGGLDAVDVPAERRAAPAIAEAELDAIVDAALAIEAEQGGAPQDVEWAISDGKLWILQARPIVVPVESGVRWESPVPGAHWRRNWRLGEWLPEPVTPLFATWVLPRLVASREEEGTGVFEWEEMHSFAMPKPWHCIVNGYFYTRQDFPTDRPGRPQSLDERIAAMARNTARIRRWHTDDLPKYVRHFEHHRHKNIAACSPAELVAFVEQLVAEAGEIWFFLSPIGYGFEEMVFKPLYDRLVPGEKPHYSVLFSGYESRMLDAQVALCELAARVREHKALTAELQALDPSDESALARLPRWLRQAIRAYDDEYGHQVLSLDLYWPTLGESAEHVLRSLQLLAGADVPHPLDSLRTAQARRASAEQDVLARLDDADKRERFRITVAFYQGNAAVREDCNFYFQIGWPLMRRAVQLLGAGMTQAGVIATPEQIHFLEWEEVRGWVEDPAVALDLAALARGRQSDWERQRRLHAPDTLGGGDESAESGDGAERLSGYGASPGIGRGPVRVVITDADAQSFQRGDVLVIKAASPLFTPLMLMASALVVEVGGGASHSSLVAREIGLPAAVNVGDATRLLHNGERVEVDGEAGTVRRVDP